MKEKRYTVWQNIEESVVDWRYDYQEAHELSDEEMKDVSEDVIYNWMYEMLYEYLDDERANLNIKLDDEIDCDYCDWYCDRYDFRFDGFHHDGRNHYLYRTWAKGLTFTQKENFLEKLYSGKATHKDVLRYTRSIRPYIAKVYGW